MHVHDLLLDYSGDDAARRWEISSLLLPATDQRAARLVELNHVTELILVLISMVKIDFEQLNRLFLVNTRPHAAEPASAPPRIGRLQNANTHMLVHVLAEAGSVACSPADVVLGS